MDLGWSRGEERRQTDTGRRLEEKRAARRSDGNGKDKLDRRGSSDGAVGPSNLVSDQRGIDAGSDGETALGAAKDFAGTASCRIALEKPTGIQ
ncbi:hypothetical protein NL676_017619 [Syzygium grande]|nr:hypothetical protein NL676_017619 [Syzygium grande]